jgi:hypothetical protein
MKGTYEDEDSVDFLAVLSHRDVVQLLEAFVGLFPALGLSLGGLWKQSEERWFVKGRGSHQGLQGIRSARESHWRDYGAWWLSVSALTMTTFLDPATSGRLRDVYTGSNVN